MRCVIFFNYLETKKYKLHVRVFLSRYRGYTVCPDCKGTRLRAEARSVFVAGKNIGDVCRMTIRESKAFFEKVETDDDAAGNRRTHPWANPLAAQISK